LPRQASEQYFTSAQLLAQRRRQLIGRPQATQGLLGNAALLPRKPVLRPFIFTHDPNDAEALDNGAPRRPPRIQSLSRERSIQRSSRGGRGAA
jgi:hypothetical protein